MLLWEGSLREGAVAIATEGECEPKVEQYAIWRDEFFLCTQAPSASRALGTSLSDGGLKKDNPFTGSK